MTALSSENLAMKTRAFISHAHLSFTRTHTLFTPHERCQIDHWSCTPYVEAFTYFFWLQEELKRDLIKLRREKEKAQAAAAQAAAAVSAHVHSGLSSYAPAVTSPSAAHKRKRDEERDAASKSKRKKMISTTSKDNKRDIKLYCICKTPYDESKYETFTVLWF